MSEEEKTEGCYAALCCGDDDTGSWLWCHVSSKLDTKKPFYANVENGAWQLRYDPVSRLMTVVETKQVVMGVRLAGIGRVPMAWFEGTSWSNTPSNQIIEKYLRTGEYQTVEYFVHDRY